jgi:outer membrane protein OmpA-like peptidoglycan-associated protein
MQLALAVSLALLAAPVDKDKDKVNDADDWCPTVPETVNQIDDEDGCPDASDGLVRIDGDKIEILERIGFLANNATILKRSKALLDQIASAIKESPHIVLVRIEGHTDDQGAEEANLKLSTQRALAVKQALVTRGVESARLEHEGFGSKKPRAKNDTEEGRAENRRVDFVVAKVNKEAATAGGNIALLLNTKGTVGVDQPNGLKGKATPGMNLPNASLVATGVDGTCEVNLPTSSRLQIRPSSQTKIWTRNDGTTPSSRVQVAAGSLWAKVAGPAPGKEKEKFEVKTPNATISARGTEFTIGVEKNADGTYATQVSTLEGAVSVAVGPKVIEVPAGQGVSSVGTEVKAPRALPSMPTGLNPYWGEFDKTVSFNWKSMPNVGFRVQVAADVGFTQIVRDQVVATPAFSFTPGQAGSYFWRVIATDEGLESPPSQRFEIKIK